MCVCGLSKKSICLGKVEMYTCFRLYSMSLKLKPIQRHGPYKTFPHYIYIRAIMGYGLGVANS